jgi:transposase
MLGVEIRFMIKDMHRKGISISEIARQTGHDRKTVRKVINGDLQPKQKKSQPPRPRKIDPYTDYLQRRMAEGVYNTRKLYREIQAQDYPGGLTQVILYVQPFRPPRQEKATVRFETEPGQQAQVDWGSCGYEDDEGRHQTLYCFVMTLGWSRMMYVEFTTEGDTGSFMRCHQHAFEYFGGVPREVLHDNLKSAVIDRDADGTIHFNTRYLDFALATGFTPRPHQPYRPQTKGKVENGVRYVKGNFWVGLHFIDVDDINHQARVWLDTVANPRVHGTTGETPFSRLPDEHLQPLPGQRFDTSRISYRHVGRDCLVNYQRNRYSVPAVYAQQTVMVKETEDQQIILVSATGEVIAEHLLLHGRYQSSVDPLHYAGLPDPLPRRGRKPLAFQTTSGGDDTFGRWIAPQVEQRSLHIYEQVLEGSHD